jgi:hypothetical protein
MIMLVGPLLVILLVVMAVAAKKRGLCRVAMSLLVAVGAVCIIRTPKNLACQQDEAGRWMD